MTVNIQNGGLSRNPGISNRWTELIMAIAAVGMQYPEFLYRPSPKNRPFVSLDQLKKHDTELEVPYFE